MYSQACITIRQIDESIYWVLVDSFSVFVLWILTVRVEMRQYDLRCERSKRLTHLPTSMSTLRLGSARHELLCARRPHMRIPANCTTPRR